MRGNHFINILTNIEIIEKVFKKLKRIDRPTTVDFKNLITTFNTVPGIGLSTFSKILYFLQITFNDNPCLILDQRLIDVFANKTYSDFEQLSDLRYDNAENQYLDYLHMINNLSKKLETNGENIEMFLFIFGNFLRTSS